MTYIIETVKQSGNYGIIIGMTQRIYYTATL